MHTVACHKCFIVCLGKSFSLVKEQPGLCSPWAQNKPEKSERFKVLGHRQNGPAERLFLFAWLLSFGISKFLEILVLSLHQLYFKVPFILIVLESKLK